MFLFSETAHVSTPCSFSTLTRLTYLFCIFCTYFCSILSLGFVCLQCCTEYKQKLYLKEEK